MQESIYKLQFRWIKLIDHTFEIGIVYIQKAVRDLEVELNEVLDSGYHTREAGNYTLKYLGSTTTCYLQSTRQF